MAILEVDSIIVRYGKMEALHGVSLNVEKGNITALIGHNGGGKTTALETIAGLVKVHSGTITFKGQRINNMPPDKIVSEGISLVSADKKLFPYLSVHDNLRMGSYCKRAWTNQSRNIETIYGLFPKLSQLRHQESRTLSGGEQQMLVVGRALMSEPEILLLDEPTTGLAPILVNKVCDAIQDVRKRGVTVLVAEQGAAKILSIANNAYVVENGQILMKGTSQELFNNPLVVEAFLRV